MTVQSDSRPTFVTEVLFMMLLFLCVIKVHLVMERAHHIMSCLAAIVTLCLTSSYPGRKLVKLVSARVAEI